jgi:hypothetical protein
MGTGTKSLLWVGGIIVGLAALALLLPTSWEVERDVSIEAPVALVHQHINDFHAWRDWAKPFEADTTLEYTYEGPTSGVGAVQIWRGRSGNGRMEITRSEPEAGVWYRAAIDSVEPNGSGSLTYEVDGDAIRVIWRGEGQLWPIIGGIFAGTVESSVAAYYDYVLGNLKKVVEAKAAGAG